jgi:hypothetical protein
MIVVMVVVVMIVMVMIIVVIVMMVMVLLGECRERRQAKCGAECQGDKLFHDCRFLQRLTPARANITGVRMNQA